MPTNRRRRSALRTPSRECVPAAFFRWAQLGLESGDWVAAKRDSGINPFHLLDFDYDTQQDAEIQADFARVLVRAAEDGTVEFSDAASELNQSVYELGIRLSPGIGRKYEGENNGNET